MRAAHSGTLPSSLIAMGIIDKTTYTLKCPQCGRTGTATTRDKGSGWSGSSWGSFSIAEGFELESTGGGKVEPTIVSATCTRCSVAAEVGAPQ